MSVTSVWSLRTLALVVSLQLPCNSSRLATGRALRQSPFTSVAPNGVATTAATTPTAAAPQAPPVPSSAIAKFSKVPAAQAPGAPNGLQAAPHTPPIPPHGWVAPKIFFLFLVYVKINNEPIWDRFFDAAVQGVDYQALVHCKSEASCRENIRSPHRYEIVQSVETTYCFNLVGGMNALLRAALLHGGPGSPNDKFVFVSDSTLPVKPFKYVMDRLTVQAGPVSDFCIFPRSEWAEVTESHIVNTQLTSVTHAAVKHHQWFILSRQHAQMSVDKANELQDLMTTFQLNMGFRNTGCLDEFWHFAALFKSLDLSGYPTTVNMQGFSGSPLNTASPEVQGQCDTFVHWLPRAEGTSNNITRLAAALTIDPGTELTPVSEKRPSSILRLSRNSLNDLRKSEFLFARKVDEAATFSGCDSLEEAFNSLIFSTPPRPLPRAAPNWAGQGMWTDIRQLPVTITSLDGALRVTGSDTSMDATGSYCDSAIEVVFNNGFRAKATLTPDSQKLIWSNGVTWTRSR